VERFQNENNNNCSYFQTQQAKQQGQRIQDVAVDIAKYLHPDNNPAHKTIVHGDYKQGNMFFAANNNTAVTATSSGDNNKDIDAANQKIAVFDLQWTGPGLGATDLVYLCVMAVSDEH
jgi:Ser/Thr protein kinase RdoA (MazF antagonist)